MTAPAADLADDERQTIEWACARLINAYANLNDAADWPAVAALYADDAVMTRPTAPDQPIIGRANILDAFQARPPRITRHICTNIVITAEDRDHARGESAMLLFTGAGLPLVGTFHDRFTRTPEGWRFAERRGSMVFGA